MIKLLDDIYSWSVFSDEKQLNFNGWFIQNQSSSFGNVVIDPPQPNEKDLTQMQKMGGVQQIIITNQHHLRRASIIQKKFNSKIQINSADAGNIELNSDFNFSNGEILAGFLKAVVVPNNKTPGETALYWEKRKILFVGDALIGDPPGKLRFLPEKMYADIQRARDGIKTLMDLDFDTLLVGDGDSILSGAKPAVAEFINSN
jgi:glyoxylase-like metal-dependent hydrolase (beta-lactamase superfamily II)